MAPFVSPLAASHKVMGYIDDGIDFLLATYGTVKLASDLIFPLTCAVLLKLLAYT